MSIPSESPACLSLSRLIVDAGTAEGKRSQPAYYFVLDLEVLLQEETWSVYPDGEVPGWTPGWADREEARKQSVWG